MKAKMKRRRLQRRIRDFENTMSNSRSEAKVDSRKKSGGFRCPGSYAR